ncbi:MAG: hypothetical protein JRI57_05595 [Deltaproteobacteria bacterium]|nr:hypothetical protein [Deltaproteobacteria bacterium]MBW1951545.1 hypothetical protein [Deltaproteobacteria bacterium]MBW1986791.1 hypothetical protein [Deltaproteobacteria bacterium]MBW2135212.1 hypothetical protein [Deltaproteobacteria bacterium]
MRFKSLSQLQRPVAQEIILDSLPQEIPMTSYARSKAFKINELVGAIHHSSYEWYGYTLARRDNPELIIDIGLPKNEQNVLEYTSIDPEKIAAFQETLAADRFINGWIHSHGELEFHAFSAIDEQNHLTVLDYVTALSKKPIAKKEILIKDLTLLVADRFAEPDLAQGSVSLITDVPVAQARILETIYGGFSYGIVIGDEGWHQQQIYYKRRAILSGQTTVSHQNAEIVLVDNGQSLTPVELAALAGEVKEKINPITYKLEKLEIL